MTSAQKKAHAKNGTTPPPVSFLPFVKVMTKQPDKVLKYFDQDVKDGYTHGWYYWHFRAKQPNCADTQAQYDALAANYNSGDIFLVDSQPISDELCKKFNLASGTKHTYRHKNDKQINNGMDSLSFAFDLMCGTAEFIVWELTHNKRGV